MGGRLVEGPTMAKPTLDWEAELRGWLEPFLERLGHKARRRMCPLYVSGLIGPGDRKSVQPMAERLAPNDYDQLHHFIAGGVWDLAPLERELLIQADRLVGGSDAVLVIDDTAVPKKGKHSVGVAAQYASALGKNANCQTLVSLTLARGEVPVMVALRLFLPETWTSDPARLKRTGVPIAYRVARTKPEIALAEIDRMISAGVRFGCVLADAGYGMSAPFRQRLTARKLAWAVGIPRHLKVYPVGVRLIWPMTKGRGRPRKRRVPDILSMPAEGMLAGAKGRTVSWRSGTKGRLKARFAAVRVRIADGPPQRIWDKGQQHLPGDEAWLIGEHRVSGEKKCYLANLPAGMDLRSLAATIKARWICEQAHQQQEGGARPRPLRGKVVAWSSSSCAHDHDRLCIPPTPPARKSEAGKKESTARRLNRRCRPSGTPSSISSCDQALDDVRTAEPGSTRTSGVSKSAKVVLVA